MYKEKVMISACLLGEYCRYDGKTKTNHTILEALREYEIIPFCPEAPIFGTPRERISVVRVNGELKIMSEESKRDVTALLENEIHSFCDKNPDIDLCILKSKSPSCGNGTTPILNERGEILKLGDGIAAQILKERYGDKKFMDERDFE